MNRTLFSSEAESVLGRNLIRSEEVPIRFVDLVDPEDIGMIQRSRGLGLLHEPHLVLLRSRERFGQELDQIGRGSHPFRRSRRPRGYWDDSTQPRPWPPA